MNLMAPLQKQTEARIKDLNNLRNERFDDSIMTRNVQNDIDLTEIEMALQRMDEEEYELNNNIPDEVLDEYEIQEILNSADNNQSDEYDDFSDLQFNREWQ